MMFRHRYLYVCGLDSGGPPAWERSWANPVWSSSKGRTGRRSQRGGLGPVERIVKDCECSFKSSDDFNNWFWRVWGREFYLFSKVILVSRKRVGARQSWSKTPEHLLEFSGEMLALHQRRHDRGNKKHCIPGGIWSQKWQGVLGQTGPVNNHN